MSIQKENPTVRSVREKDFQKEYGMTLARKDEIFGMQATIDVMNALSDKEKLFRFAYGDEHLSQYPIISRRDEHEIRKWRNQKRLAIDAACEKAKESFRFRKLQTLR